MVQCRIYYEKMKVCLTLDACRPTVGEPLKFHNRALESISYLDDIDITSPSHVCPSSLR